MIVILNTKYYKSNEYVMLLLWNVLGVCLIFVCRIFDVARFLPMIGALVPPINIIIVIDNAMSDINSNVFY